MNKIAFAGKFGLLMHLLKKAVRKEKRCPRDLAFIDFMRSY